MHRLLFLLTGLFFLVIQLTNAQSDTTRVFSPQGLEGEWHITPPTDPGSASLQITGDHNGPATIKVNGEERTIIFDGGQGRIDFTADHAGELLMVKSKSRHQLVHVAQLKNGNYRVKHIPMWLSILPPLVAIVLALIFKEVVVSLFVGVWMGAFIAGGLRIESLYYFTMSLFNVVDEYILTALADSSHMAIIIFTLLIGGMVAIISKNGGMAGVVLSLSRFARSAKSAQFMTWLLGVAIFFDDYANTLIVGNTMRSVTDRFRVSREKLAYIVDSTAAPVAAVAFITTWIGAELGYIDTGLLTLRQFNFDLTPYAVFLASLKYSFYPVLTLIFILIIVKTGRDFGPMKHAELRSRETGQVSPAVTEREDEPDMENLDPVPGAPLRWYNAAIPVLVVVLVTIYGLLDTGMAGSYAQITDAGIQVSGQSWGAIWSAFNDFIPADNPNFFMKLGRIIGNADSFSALMWASLSGVIAAVLLTIGGRVIKLFDTMHFLGMGFKTMIPAIIILTLAWALAMTTDQLHTADFITSMLHGNVSPYAMPVIIFILAALISFSTGSSWSTMAILYPIAIPTTWAICHAGTLDPEIALEILLNVIATVLAASVLGDHCSPISDTTILSSLASDCNHIDHVRTQLPYALTVGGTSLLLCFTSTLLGGGWLICFILGVLGVGVLYLIVRRFGQPITDFRG